MVTTDSGAVRGAWHEHTSADGRTSRHAVFRGIPFAAAPVGQLRFAAPQPPVAWDGVRDATQFGPTPQRISPYNPPRVPEPSIPGEETLNVSVTTPDPSASAGLPVLVYIHGGGFIGGSPASPWYVGEAFARDGVVTAVLSYRLGFEGFAWLADAGRDGVVNNRGVLDWLFGLEWVQRNIAAFGGDPSRVTIAGQSAGGAAVMRLLTMPSAQHLFQGVLALSPADASSPVEATAEATRRVAQASGCEPTAESASRVHEDVFFAHREAVDSPRDPSQPRIIFKDAPLALAPCVDGEVCEQTVSDALAAGVGADKRLFIGSTAHEFTMMLSPSRQQLAGLDPVPLLVEAGASEELARDVVEDARERGELERGTAWVLGQAISDVIFRSCVAHWAQTRKGGPAPPGRTTSGGSRARPTSRARRTASTSPSAWTCCPRRGSRRRSDRSRRRRSPTSCTPTGWASSATARWTPPSTATAGRPSSTDRMPVIGAWSRHTGCRSASGTRSTPRPPPHPAERPAPSGLTLIFASAHPELHPSHRVKRRSGA